MTQKVLNNKVIRKCFGDKAVKSFQLKAPTPLQKHKTKLFTVQIGLGLTTFNIIRKLITYYVKCQISE